MSEREGLASKFRPRTAWTLVLAACALLTFSPPQDLFAAGPKVARGKKVASGGGGRQDAPASDPRNAPARGASIEASVGIPWTGAPGITETVAQIMERDKRTPSVPVDEETEQEPNHTIRGVKLEQNPLAPAVPQWPPQEGAIGVGAPYAAQTLGISFLGADKTESPYRPPDTMGAVGPSQVLVIINGRIKVFSKTGVLGALNTTTDTFFNSVRFGSSVSDPQVRYDRLSGRWFLSMITVSAPNRVCLAVSNGSTITNASSFTFFSFQHDLVGLTPNIDTGQFADYDSLGVDQNALYVGINVFNAAGTSLLGSTGFVIRKSDLLAGILTVSAFRGLMTCSGSCTAGPFAPRGVDNDDPAAAQGFFIGHDAHQFSRLAIRRIENPGTTPAISANILLTVPTTTFPIDQPAIGSLNPLDSLDFRLFDAAIHKNKTTGVSSLWTAHNIEVNTSGVGALGGGRNGSRWYQISNLSSTPVLTQSGTLFDSSPVNPLGFWIPSVAMSGQGHMALGSSRAGTANFAEIAVTGRLSDDALGTLQAPTLAQTSAFTYNLANEAVQRWGDYSQVAVDPVDDMTLWTFQEYCSATNVYGIRVLQLLAPPPATPAGTSPSSLAQGATGTVTLTGTAVSGSGFFDPGPGFESRIAAAVNGAGVNVTGVTYTDPTHLSLNVSVSAGAALGARTITVTNPDGQAMTSASGILTITAGGPVVTVTGINPNNGPPSGGTPVTITGTNFQSGATVTIGGVPATGVVFGSATSLTAVTGAHASGPADVTVVNPDTSTGTLTNGYTYNGNSFFTVPPCRILDTRDPAGPSGGPPLSPGSVRTFPVTGLCAIPSTAKAVAIMLAVVSPGDGGDIRLYPAGNSPPATSAINVHAGAIRANNGVIPLGVSGQMSALLDMPLGSIATAHLVIDVYGYFQ